MCHLYDIDSDFKAIKHSSFRHDTVQDAIALASAECDAPITWESAVGKQGVVITQGFIDNEMVYEIIE